jgi:hypothetical protein
MKTTKRKPVNLTSPVLLQAADTQDDGPRKFIITAYTGAVIPTYYGALVFDVSGMSAKPKMPVLREHHRDRIVGFGKGSHDNNAFTVAGAFSQSTIDGVECMALADEGYPWQASVGIRPVKVKTIDEKEEFAVNGKTLKGPAEIWLKSEVGEVSFVSLGADSNTSISVFSELESEIDVELESSRDDPTTQTKGAGVTAGPNKETQPMTKEELIIQDPELAASLKAEGIMTERDRVTRILASDPEMKHLTVLKQAIEAGTSADGIFKDLFEAERQFRQTGLKNLADQATPSVGQSRTEIETASAPKTFFGEVSEVMKAQNLSMADAVRKVQFEQPDLHQTFLKEQSK